MDMIVYYNGSYDHIIILSMLLFYTLYIPVPPGVLGIWGEWLFVFRELGSTGQYFKGAREQAHNLGDLGSLAKKQKKKRKSLHFV